MTATELLTEPQPHRYPRIRVPQASEPRAPRPSRPQNIPPPVPSRPLSWPAIGAAIAVLSVGLWLVPGRTGIAPLVESDYCYQLLAADRLLDGQGLTTPPPVAPGQSWEWRGDWAHLTQWPPGYPLLVGGIRWLSGWSTLQVCRAISVVACAAGLVGWFAWMRRCVPRGVGGLCLSAVAAAIAVSPAALINPSTDALVVALVPFVLMLAAEAIDLGRAEGSTDVYETYAAFALAGLSAGILFCIRYAGAFIPIGIAGYLLVGWLRRRRPSAACVLVFALSAVTPAVALLAANEVLSEGTSLQSQLNLGETIRPRFSLELLATAWWNLTNLGFYEHHSMSRYVYAMWPAALFAVLLLPSLRKEIVPFVGGPAFGVSVGTILALLVLVVGCSALFADKFNYASLERYYLPVRPLYFAVFAAPVLWVARRPVRAMVATLCVLALIWIVEIDWTRPYQRWARAERERTSYGAWARPFSPGASDLYEWLKQQQSPDLLVVSNFPEYIALETQIPAVPVPADRATLNQWLAGVAQARGIETPRVLFVLSRNYLGREYWVPPITKVVQEFPRDEAWAGPDSTSAEVFAYKPDIKDTPPPD